MPLRDKTSQSREDDLLMVHQLAPSRDIIGTMAARLKQSSHRSQRLLMISLGVAVYRSLKHCKTTSSQSFSQLECDMERAKLSPLMRSLPKWCQGPLRRVAF